MNPRLAATPMETSELQSPSVGLDPTAYIFLLQPLHLPLGPVLVWLDLRVPAGSRASIHRAIC